VASCASWRCHARLAALLYQKEDVEAALGAPQLALKLGGESELGVQTRRHGGHRDGA
jgi:hypothetical protein